MALSCVGKYLDTLPRVERIPVLTASTASPYKFAADVLASLGDQSKISGPEALTALSAFTGTDIPAPLAGLDKRRIRFERVAEVRDMPTDVLAQLK